MRVSPAPKNRSPPAELPTRVSPAAVAVRRWFAPVAVVVVLGTLLTVLVKPAAPTTETATLPVTLPPFASTSV